MTPNSASPLLAMIVMSFLFASLFASAALDAELNTALLSVPVPTIPRE